MMKSAFKETEEEFRARMEKEGSTVMPDIDVKMSEHQEERDVLAAQARTGYSGQAREGMEQSVRSQSYKDADEYIARQAKKKGSN